jgi:hypothetical protein
MSNAEEPDAAKKNEDTSKVPAEDLSASNHSDGTSTLDKEVLLS